MQIRQLSLVAAISALTFTTTTNAVLGPIPIYLNTEYRTPNPVIGSIASTLSFSSDDIKSTGANTFLDFLSSIPSVGLVNPTGNVPAIFIRGNEARHTLILVDGVNIHDASSTDAAAGYGLTTITLNDIEKVDIIKGSGSVLYGASAVAGVINIATKKGADGNKAIMSAKFGTSNAKTYTLSASSGNKDGFVRLTHNQYTNDGINAQTGDTTNEKDSVDNIATQIKIGNEHYSITYLKSRSKTEYDGWGGTDNNELSDRNLNTITINSHKKISNDWNANVLISQTESRRDSGSNATTIGDKLESTSIALLNDINIGNALLNVGLSNNNIENITDKLKHNSQEVFANWQQNINNIDINTGVRHIKHNKFGNKIVYGLGIAKYLDNNIKLTSSYNSTFNSPSLFHLNNSPNLNPETGKNIEIGIEKQYDKGLISAKFFNNKVKSFVTYDGTWNAANDYTNTDKLSTKGIDLHGNTSVFDYYFNLDYNYVDSKLNNENAQSIRRPKNTINLTINKQNDQFNPTLQIIKKSSSLDTLNNTRLEGYTLVNLSSNYAINNNSNVSLTIKNATNKDYTTAVGYNTLGRAIEIGLDYNF